MKFRLLTALGLGLAGAAIASLPLSANAQVRPQARATDYNYVGAGVGIGDLGDSDVGLTVNSKFTVGDNVSLRPGVITNFDFDNGGTVFLAPVTYDFNAVTPNGRLLPFVGGGVAVSTGEDGNFGGLVTGGADYRINERLTANGSVNWSISNDSEVYGVVGVGYTF